MRCVLIESPFAGDVKRNVQFARACLRDSLLRGEAPFASHLLYTQPGILNDDVPDERALGINAGLVWGEKAEATAVYVDLGVSHGMRLGIERGKEIGRPVELRMLDRGKFVEILRRICSRETAHDSAVWTADNPLHGHCAVVALLAQDLFGGTILRVSLEGTEFAAMRSHYYNLLPDGAERDFTREQFGGRFPEGLRAEERARSYLFSNSDTLNRYVLLEERFQEIVFG